jgi:hypothetical protein
VLSEIDCCVFILLDNWTIRFENNLLAQFLCCPKMQIIYNIFLSPCLVIFLFTKVINETTVYSSFSMNL